MTYEEFISYEYNQDKFSQIISEQLFKKEQKNFHTITSKEDFNQLIGDTSEDIEFLFYQPLNDHSRQYLSIGDILFSYRSGQFENLSQALQKRGIYGLGIALTNPIKISDEHSDIDDYRNYGIFVLYPFKLKEHLSVRDIQMNPKTNNLTPYNGNRNDSLQHIPEKIHYQTILGMILYKNKFLKDFFSFLNLDVKECIIPDVIWDHFNETVNQNRVKKTEKKKSDILGFNRIYFGAPGTGKSYAIQQFIRKHGLPDYDEKYDFPNVFRITLHPEFSYSDFVGQIMPVVTQLTEDNTRTQIEYKFKPQTFTNALKYAFSHLNEPVFLVLEEMSRANVAAVFGDIFQLLDRNDDGESEYRINNDLIATEVFGDPHRKVYLPNNLFILGTVNTSDQNVFVMDTAFKRRFELTYIDAQRVAINEMGNALNNFTFKFTDVNKGDIEFDWVTLYQVLNDFITSQHELGLGLSEDKQVGQFFIRFKNNDEIYNYNQFSGKLLHYLWNDVQKASYSDVSLFKKEFVNYSQLYRAVQERKNIFSEELLEKLQQKNGR